MNVKLLKIFFCYVLMFNVLSVMDVALANQPFNKLSRGVVNVITSPVEIPREVRGHWITGSEKTYHVVPWIFCGVVKGFVMMPARMVSGFWDVISFPLPVPKNYKSLRNPEFVFDDWPKRQEGVIYKNLGEK